MASADTLRRSPFSADAQPPSVHKAIPILPSTTANSNTLTPPGEPMDITAGTANMAQPVSPNAVGDGTSSAAVSHGDIEPSMNGTAGPAIGAAAAAQQPKVVQTAFIHKLYNMLEDQSIQHLISWSNTNESFVMSPSSEFSKVLSSYFKHTNISSFVRQLNMYGFHKVSDVFHTGSPDSPLWEFKHGNGSFKRGDLAGLREIKRRASRHALIHRDSFPTPKVPAPPPPPPPAPSVDTMPDPVEARLSIIEHNLYDTHSRLARSEDSYAFLNQKYQFLMESLQRCHQWNIDISSHLLALVPDPEHPVHRETSMMRQDILRQLEQLRATEESREPLHSARQPYFSNLSSDNVGPVSPRQLPQDDHRRSSLLNNSQSSLFRPPPLAAHLSVSPRRYGSIGAGAYSPSSARTPAPPPPPPSMQGPMISINSPPANLSRRHTSADIRLHGWQNPGQPPSHSPFASGANSTHWPSSPSRGPVGNDNEQIRSAFASYSISGGPRQAGSRHATPPPPHENPSATNLSAEAGWQLPGARYPFKGFETPGPPTRRSSMASNVHSLLNPAETAERADEDEVSPNDDRKRKRLQ